MDVKLWLRHKLTAYHLRNGFAEFMGRKKTKLFICSCGWQPWRWRLRKYRSLRRTFQCWPFRGHDWEDWYPMEIGEVYEEDGEWKSAIDEGHGHVVGYMRQCQRCWKVETKD